jgi:N-acetyl-1-D-myo-inositol-2-amino-2-deoxy-alpha-D-glucopyranoside deacetylase
VVTGAVAVGWSRRLLVVHAHPDDESITTGGLLSRCGLAGIGTTLVSCTDGRYGPVNPELGVRLTPDQLADTRALELNEAARILAISLVRRLGYHDSNMTGLAQNHAPQAFWAQPIEVLVSTLVGVIRETRPHVVVTYDAFGNTGHLDHIQAHRVTMLAVGAASEARCFRAAGPIWNVRQVFHPVYPVSALRQFLDEEQRAGRPHPFEGRNPSEINYARADEDVTHRVDIREVYDRKARALRAHRTQIGPHYPLLYRTALARRHYEHFRLAWQRQSTPDFDDIFESAAS